MSCIKKRLKNRRGQIAIFVLMMFSFLFMLFGMAINVAMLVHHKINLQNAADMSALAGAAEQARILNMISWKNYELRKNYKDFTYRYWIGFNDRHPLFPDPRPNSSARLRKRRVLAAGGDFMSLSYDGVPGIPSYCLGDVFAAQIRACEITQNDGVTSNIPNISPYGMRYGSAAPISAPLLDASYNSAREKSEQVRGQWASYDEVNWKSANEDVNVYLRRADRIYNTYLNPNNPNTLVGMLNRSLEQRIQGTIPGAWSNYAASNIRGGPGLQGTYHLSSELTEAPADFHTLAEKTAYNNLNYNLREGFEFIPLLPQSNRYIDVDPIELHFTTFYTSFPTTGELIVPERFNPLSTQDGMYVGIAKRETTTFYSVMLKSRPKLPFLPGNGPWEMTAVAAAKPFGSRIGPKKDLNDYLTPIPQGVINYIQSKGVTLAYPNLPILKVDEGLRLSDVQVMHDVKAVMYSESLESEYGRERLEPFLSPTEWEASRYAFPDPSTAKGQIHWTDKPTARATGAFPAAKNLAKSWGPDGTKRSGYSIKLVPISSIVDRLEPEFQDPLRSILH